MRRQRPVLLTAALLLATAACADSPTAVDPMASASRAGGGGSEGRGVFHRYVAIGTSVSMGVQSDGVNLETQQTSWPAQLARLASRELSLPLIAYPGCPAPLAHSLATGVRLSGESAALPLIARACAPNVPGVTLPTGNVAMDGARTIHALTATPENPDPTRPQQYLRVLAPGMTQLSAMEAQDPKIVSVELGANDILGARSGVFIPGVSVVPVPVWAGQYAQVVDRVVAASKHAVLVGLLDDLRNLPAIRAGSELWDARATFAPFNVVVSADCQNSANSMFVAIRVPVAVAKGAEMAGTGAGPHTLSCANLPSASGVVDYVLGPDEVPAVNAQLAAMNAIIRGHAETHGLAYFDLGALYDDAYVKAPFSAITLMTSTQPYGPLMSLDGVHPSALGARVLADAAATALNARYGFGIPTAGNVMATIARR